MCSRADLPVAVRGKNAVGCCGPSGSGGPNLECPCGVAFATEIGDCWQPHVVAVDPERVDRVPATPAVRVHVYPAKRESELAAWLHEILAAEDWYGTDFDPLAEEWSRRAPGPIVIVWIDANRAAQDGVEVDTLLRKLQRARSPSSERAAPQAWRCHDEPSRVLSLVAIGYAIHRQLLVRRDRQPSSPARSPSSTISAAVGSPEPAASSLR